MTRPRATSPGGGWTVLVLAAAGIAAAGILYWLVSAPAPVADAAAAAAEPVPTAGRAVTVLLSDRAGAERQIAQAQDAIATQIGQPPLQGPVTQRPDFVSELEWRLFQGVAHNHPDPAAELTLLVNRLRFYRLEQLWRQLRDSGGDPALERRLGQQLLDELPGRVREAQFDLAQAQSLQQEVLTVLVSDPIARAQRASAESQRLQAPASQP